MSRYGVLSTFLAAAVLVGGCNATPPSAGHLSAADIALRFEVVDNHHDGADSFKGALTVTNTGTTALGREGWELYFNFGRTFLPESLPAAITVTYVNGDFFRLEPTEKFPPIKPGGSLRLSFAARNWVIKESEAPAGFYFVFTEEGGAVRAEAVADVTIAPLTAPRQTDRMVGDKLPVPTPASRFERNREVTRLERERVVRIVPTPVSITTGNSKVTLDASWSIRHAAGLEGEAAYLAGALEALLGAVPSTAEGGGKAAGVIVLRVGAVTVADAAKKPGDEAYRLTVDRDAGIEITGSDAAGVFYGIQSLRALLPIAAYRQAQEAITIDEATLEDAPRFGHRGLHLDVARNFQSREAVEKLLDLMAFYKLNRFHFHLTDDEGWRLAIAALPELTAVGGRRGHTTDERDRLVPSFGSGPDPERSHGSGWYTREDFIAILRYARERHIEVLPEIDVPGHARAAVKAMEARHASLAAEGRAEEARAFLLSEADDSSQYRSVQGWTDNVINVCQPSAYRFLETVVDDLIAMYAEAGAPLAAVHTGGDEVPHGVWEASPACERLIRDDADLASVADLPGYFLRRVSAILAERGLITAGWEEIALVEESRDGRAVKTPNPAFVAAGLRPYVWNSVWGWGSEDVIYKLANAGYRVVMANASNLYFDLAYDKDPQEPGYYWAGFVDTKKPWELVPFDLFKSAREDLMGNPIDAAIAFADRVRPTAAGRRNILGIQGQIWGENAKGQAMMEYLAFPKVLGLAERAWAAPPAWAAIAEAAEREPRLAAAWNEFANRLGQRELPRLDHLHGGVAYRLPPPGAVIADGVLQANVAFPGLEIRYTADGSEPTAGSTLYTGPVAVSGTVKLRTFDTRGRGGRTAVVVSQ